MRKSCVKYFLKTRKSCVFRLRISLKIQRDSVCVKIKVDPIDTNDGISIRCLRAKRLIIRNESHIIFVEEVCCMDIRKANIIVGKSGGNAKGESKTFKLSLPTAWMRELGIDDDSRQVELSFDGEKIVLQKALTLDEFAKARISHVLL